LLEEHDHRGLLALLDLSAHLLALLVRAPEAGLMPLGVGYKREQEDIDAAVWLSVAQVLWCSGRAATHDRASPGDSSGFLHRDDLPSDRFVTIERCHVASCVLKQRLPDLPGLPPPQQEVLRMRRVAVAQGAERDGTPSGTH
jgi:hypothetical protein